jgi:CheY-like chemotaxis protein
VRTLKVLLVEDDEDHVFVVRRALRDLPDAAVTLEVAGDGEQAMERLARGRFDPDGQPQLVLLDLKMPRVDGLEVLRRIRADVTAYGLPVVADLLGARGRPRAGDAAGRDPVGVQADRRGPLPVRGPAARRGLGPDAG